ncbi:cytochrome c3 family protein [Solidesulfovibrio sp.]|uniref:cytochrome c3 family protein n=1 Tax=Solidesulfovibrio sp. TaxID=2910990 RepID=UPI00344C1A16
MAIGYEVPKDILIKRPDKNTPLAAWVGPVNFPHGFHAVQNPCKSCHHEELDRTLGQFLPCTQCHNQSGMDSKADFYRAFHNERTMSCLGCYKQKRYSGQAMPPLSCVASCHKAPEGGKPQ